MTVPRILGLLFVSTWTLVLAQHDINTGEGLYSLKFPGGGAIESTRVSSELPRTFSFEAWAMSPMPRDGTYKTIVSRFGPGPEDRFHNRWADFDFQVQASGTLNFFMGNGEPDIYGVLISAGQFPALTWVHLAFTVQTLPGNFNPWKVTIYVNGMVVAEGGWLTKGIRQDSGKLIPVQIGGYMNQDNETCNCFLHPDPNKWWRGYLDEVRFWNGLRDEASIKQYMHRVVPYRAPGLLSYLRLNEAAGTVAHDSSPEGRHFYFTNPLALPSTPIWKASGAKIHVDVDVGIREEVLMTLPGISTVPPFQLGFTYNIKTLPSKGELWANGHQITFLPFALKSNQVLYRGPRGNREPTQFEYYGGPPDEKIAAIVFLDVRPLPPVVDICGVTGGDNSTCSCLAIPFNGYSLNDVERVLLLWEIEQTIDVLHRMQLKLDQAAQLVTTAFAADLQHIIDAVGVFFDRCIRSLGTKMLRYTDQLSAM